MVLSLPGPAGGGCRSGATRYFHPPRLPHRAMGPSALAPSLLPYPHRQPDRRAGEPELLPQPPLQEPPVARLEETRGEQHEGRGPGFRLCREEDLGLLAAPHGRWGRGDDVGEPAVEPPGGDAGVP